ncbi:MAG: hypothetical protein LBO71_10985 [Prevotellaceae bacterium]|jgi:hypothetical protein|nr:hypothetical protein [Prevotellaceae bacterium]
MVGEKGKDIIFELYRDSRTVFRINDIALMLGETETSALRKRLHYHVQKGKLLNIRQGIYAKSGYKPEEVACLLYTPTYISLEYVLQRAGVIFQYDSAITNASYLSREVSVGNQTIRYRQIKGEILLNADGVILRKNNINIATPERAFLDMLYLNSHFYFDNLHPLNKKQVKKILPIYRSKKLAEKVNQILTGNEYR